MAEKTTLIREVAVSYRGAQRKVVTPLRVPADAVAFVRRVVAPLGARGHCPYSNLEPKRTLYFQCS